MDRGYDPEKLKREAEKASMMNNRGERGSQAQLEMLTKEIEALHQVVGGLSESLSPILLPAGVTIAAGAITAEKLAEMDRLSPLADEIDTVRARAQNARLQLQHLMERIDL